MKEILKHINTRLEKCNVVDFYFNFARILFSCVCFCINEDSMHICDFDRTDSNTLPLWKIPQNKWEVWPPIVEKGQLVTCPNVWPLVL